MIKEFKIFEIFDSTNIYDYKLVKKSHEYEDGDGYDLYIVEFVSDDGTKYFVRVSFFNELKDNKKFKNFMTIDFMDEEQYKQNINVHYEINFKNTGKHEAIKIINTVFTILIDYRNKLNPYIVSFDCTKDRYKTYEYCVKKFFGDFIIVNYCYDEEDKCDFYLYNPKYFKISEDGYDVLTMDNRIVYSGTREDNISEALKISQYRDHYKKANSKFVQFFRYYFRNYFNDGYSIVSKNGYRIYFPIEIDIANVNIEPPHEITDWLRWNGYNNINYRKGTCFYGSREIKLGRLFQEKGRNDLLKTFVNDPKRDIKETKFYVVISCHPYDILGMSTGRGWSTCHDLEDIKYGGHHVHHLFNSMKNGILVAYLIRRNDMNIKNPISRCTLNGGIAVSAHIYGVNLSEFGDFLRKWTVKFRNDLQRDKDVYAGGLLKKYYVATGR